MQVLEQYAGGAGAMKMRRWCSSYAGTASKSKGSPSVPHISQNSAFDIQPVKNDDRINIESSFSSKISPSSHSS